MPLSGIIWGTIIYIPFWLIVILLVKAGDIAIETLIFVGLILSGLLLFLILTTPQNTKQFEQDKQPFITATKVRSIYKLDKKLKMTDNGGTRLELIGGNLNTPLISRKEDRVWTVEKNLIAEVEYREEEYLSAELA
jgi:hypothetical protein